MAERGDRSAPDPRHPAVSGLADADWRAVAELEPHRRGAAVLARVLADLADEARQEAIVDDAACAAWLAGAAWGAAREPDERGA